ncbi:MAG: CAP domain-containing protein [Cyanobacteria bacterium P01_F01_bin.42]
MMSKIYASIFLGGLFLLTPKVVATAEVLPAAKQTTPVLQKVRGPQRSAEQNQWRQLALNLVNRDRFQQGIPGLLNNPLLDQVAQAHAEDMIRQNYLSHYGKDGSTPEQRVRSAGGHMFAGENILSYHIKGRRRRSELIVEFQHLFLESDRHRKIMMRSRYSQFGYGFAVAPDGRIVAVQMFGIPDPVSTAP